MTTKTKNIIAWVFAIVLAIIFLFVGITKLLGTEMQVKNLEGWGFPLWTRFPIGIIEILIGVGLLWPKFQKITVYGTLIWAVLAAITHIQAGEISQFWIPLVMGLVAWLIIPLSRKTE